VRFADPLTRNLKTPTPIPFPGPYRDTTVVATCKQNLVNFCDYITRVVEADFQGHSPPKLLPAPPLTIAA
jgi:hypothetical protein